MKLNSDKASSQPDLNPRLDGWGRCASDTDELGRLIGGGDMALNCLYDHPKHSRKLYIDVFPIRVLHSVENQVIMKSCNFHLQVHVGVYMCVCVLSELLKQV